MNLCIALRPYAIVTWRRNRGFEPLAAYCGQDASLQVVSWSPDEVIADVIMGSMDAVSLGDYLRQAEPSCECFSSPALLQPTNC